jgi:Uma2 family endonuclease
MSHPTQPYTWTYAEYARFPDDGNRYEVIDGEVLVTPAPSPRHQYILANLLVAMRAYVEQHRLGVVLPDVDVLFVSGQFLRPDLVFVPESARAGITDRGVELPPGLIIEVLSPTSSSIDRVKKPRRYGDFGVPEYWVADPQERAVWVWRFAAGAVEPERVADHVTWAPAAGVEPLVLAAAEIFREL